MRVTVSFNSYNERRYGTPWIAKVTTWPVGGKAELQFGGYCGDSRHGGAGEAEIDAEVGDIVRWGQKDNRNAKGTEANWGIVEGNGTIKDLTASQARELYGKVITVNLNPLAGFSDGDLLAEIKRRGL